MQIGFIVSLVFAIIITVFALKNGESVSVDFIFTTREVSQAIVIFASAAIGAIIVTLLGLIRQVKLSLKVRELTKKLKAMEDDKSGLVDETIKEDLDDVEKEEKIILNDEIEEKKDESKNKELTMDLSDENNSKEE